MQDIQEQNPTNMILTADLQQAVQVIKGAIQRSQARSLQHVNNEVLSLYYGIGQYISENTRHHFWGTGALKTISNQLQKEMPGLTGFGETSLKNMRTFYEEWSEYVNRQPAVDELPIDETELLVQIRQPLGDELNWADFLRVPFTHHVIILRKVKDLNERAFYIHMCASRAWNQDQSSLSLESLKALLGKLTRHNRKVVPLFFVQISVFRLKI